MIYLINLDFCDANYGTEVSLFPILELENLIRHFLNYDNYILENEPAVSIHTYPKSSHFRDIVSVTTDDCVSIHSLDVLSKPCPKVHPLIVLHNTDVVDDYPIIDIKDT